MHVDLIRLSPHYMLISLQMVAFQRQYIHERIKRRSMSHQTYGGISLIEDGNRRKVVSILDVPGVLEGRSMLGRCT